MLAFVNYAHYSKKCRKYAITFYFKFGKNNYGTNKKLANICTSLYALAAADEILENR